MKTAVFAVVYKNAGPYIDDFLLSLSTQTDKDFTLYLINDDLPGAEQLITGYDLRVKIKKSEGSPVRLRKLGIEWVTAEGMDAVIFADSDDYFHRNRIEVVKKLLLEDDIVVNELALVGQGFLQPLEVIGRHFKEGAAVCLRDIKTKNCIGLSNSAVLVKKIPANIDQIPDTIPAFDWAFFWLCLYSGCGATFTKKTVTYYRQHQNNIAALQTITRDRLVASARVKSDHYHFLSRFNAAYQKMGEVFFELSNKLEHDDAYARVYRQRVARHLNDFPLWWETVKQPEELGL